MPSINKLRSVLKLKDLMGDGLIKSGEPQKSYMFEVQIIDPERGNAFNNLKYYVKDVTVPSKTRDVVMLDYIGTKLIWAGKDGSAHSMNITFWDDEDLKITHFLYDWYDLAGSGQYAESTDKFSYSRDIRIVLNPTLDIGSTGTFVLKNCFPIQIGDIELSYESSDVMTVPASFSYDFIQLEDADGNVIRDMANLYGSALSTGNALEDIAGLFR